MNKTLEKLYLSEETDFFGTGYHTPEKNADGLFIINNLADPENPVLVDSLNIQTSKYHKESITDHVYMVVGKMYNALLQDDENFRIDDDVFTGSTIAVFHDIAKKCTVQINKIGEYCFYNHEEAGAKIVHEILKDSKCFNDEEKLIIEKVIEHHLRVKLLSGDACDCFKIGFETKYGKKALKFLELLVECDHGVEEISRNDEDLIHTGISISDYILKSI